ncbi:MAG TPA: hypothetical protein VFG36_01960, partial [Methanoregula sp.]|nr:hypothetical protein [Methanoregula sp.]
HPGQSRIPLLSKIERYFTLTDYSYKLSESGALASCPELFSDGKIFIPDEQAANVKIFFAGIFFVHTYLNEGDK